MGQSCCIPKRSKVTSSQETNGSLQKAFSIESSSGSKTSPPIAADDGVMPQHEQPPENNGHQWPKAVNSALSQYNSHLNDAAKDQENSDSVRSPAHIDEETFMSTEPLPLSDSQLQAPIGVSGPKQQAVVSDLTQNLRTSFKMMLILEGFPVKGCKLDTGSKFNVISERVVEELNLPVKHYDGPLAKPLGPSLQPLGEVTFNWKVFDKPRIYTTTFTILSADITQSFDTLLGEDTIAKIGFFIENDNVYYLTRPDEERAFK